MATEQGIEAQEIDIENEPRLWDVMHAAVRAKEARPGASLLPAMLILRSNEVVAKVYQSNEQPRMLLVRSCTGIRRVSLNWYDTVVMLYRTAAMTLETMEGTGVIFLGERASKEAGQAVVYAMKWTARQFKQKPPKGAVFPETQDSILQAYYVEDEKVCWLPETSTALQFA